MFSENKFFISHSNIYAGIVEHHLKEVIDYQRTMESNLEKSKKSFDKYLDGLNLLKEIEAAKNSGNEEDIYYWEYQKDDLSERYHSIAGFYPHSFRAASIIQLYSFLEFHLRSICEMVFVHGDIRFRIHEIKGHSALERAKIYLSKTANVDFGKLNPEWEFINTIRKLRNCLIHEGGQIKKSKADYLSNVGGVLLKEMNINKDIFQIQLIDKTLTEKGISSVSGFFKKLLVTELKF